MKNQKGITLIALVITIIVLLILAGVSIAMLTGDNGLLTKSQTAVMDNAIAGAKDDVSTEVQAAMVTYLENKYGKNDTTTEAIDTITEALKAKYGSDVATESGTTIKNCTVSLDESTITITKETRTVTGTIAADGTLSWGNITDVVSGS